MAVQSENAIEEECGDYKVDDAAVVCGGVPGDGEENIVATDVDVEYVQREQQRDDAAEMLDAGGIVGEEIEGAVCRLFAEVDPTGDRADLLRARFLHEFDVLNTFGMGGEVF